MLLDLHVRCSAGGHGKAQTVTWTGVLNSRRSALGLKIDWAYGPGEVKILTSSDGATFSTYVFIPYIMPNQHSMFT